MTGLNKTENGQTWTERCPHTLKRIASSFVECSLKNECVVLNYKDLLACIEIYQKVLKSVTKTCIGNGMHRYVQFYEFTNLLPILKWSKATNCRKISQHKNNAAKNRTNDMWHEHGIDVF